MSWPDDTLHAFTQILDPGPAQDGPLSGVRFAVKDNIDVAGVVTSLGRPLAEHRPAARDAAAVARLRAAGAVVVGKTNLPEFASSAVTTNAHHGDTRNPADRTRTPGGSSGGSAAAVAAGMVPVALGTDTAGSVLMPAALTGCWGFRPTHGTIDTAGVTPLSPSLDTVGVFGTRAGELSLLLTALNGTPPARPSDRLRIGVLGDLFDEAEPAVLDAVRAAVARLRDRGATTAPATLPSARAAARHGRAIYLDEVARTFAALLDPDRTYAPSVEARRAAGDPAAAATAREFRPRWQAEVDAALDGVDVLLAPTTPVVAPELPVTDEAVLVRFTYPFCLAGHPAVSVPCGTAAGLPVGLLLVGRRGGDRALLAAAATVGAHLDRTDDTAGGTAP
jgi:aspartyl-tRNA(Asn)/glutamyl-tRNA(Gln) amidotransferase subunit A